MVRPLFGKRPQVGDGFQAEDTAEEAKEDEQYGFAFELVAQRTRDEVDPYDYRVQGFSGDLQSRPFRNVVLRIEIHPCTGTPGGGSPGLLLANRAPRDRGGERRGRLALRRWPFERCDRGGWGSECREARLGGSQHRRHVNQWVDDSKARSQS